jgi:predicted patatin/cPLA2 family phospholipase
MKINTLILSGGSTKGISFIGCIKYLIEKNYINKDFKNIKKIICVSASFIFVLTLIILNYDLKSIEEITYNYNFEDFLDINDISLKNLVDNYGFINYNRFHIHVKDLLKDKYNVDKMSLLKLFKLTNIHIIVKTINVSKQTVEYIDHINNPKINILKLIQMTTAIPILIKPIKYKGDLYCDGGLCGNCPNEINDSDDYICIDICANKFRLKINNIFDYLQSSFRMYDPNILTRKYDIKNIKIDLSELNLNTSSFNISNEIKKDILRLGYEQTVEHFTHYLHHPLDRN